MLKTRVLTALIGIPLFLIVLALPGGDAFCVSVCVMAGIGLWEFERAFRSTPYQPSSIFLLGGSLMPIIVWQFSIVRPEGMNITLLTTCLIVGLLAVGWEFYSGRKEETHPIAHNLGLGLLGAFYVGGLLSFLLMLRITPSPYPMPGGLDGGVGWVLLLMAPLWAGDSAAFFAGRAFGKHKLAPQLSPNKTWEGAWANLIACAATGMFVSMGLGTGILFGFFVGAGIGVLGQVGDLFESAMKRSLGVKDFGALLPGHGGALDRFDSALFCAPYVWVLLQIWLNP